MEFINEIFELITRFGVVWFFLFLFLVGLYRFQEREKKRLRNYIRLKGYKPDFDFIESENHKYYEDKWIDSQIKNDIDYIKQKCNELGLDYVIPKGTAEDYVYYLYKNNKEIASSYGKDVILFKLKELEEQLNEDKSKK
ncbi:MAG: hypothetical protein A2V66_07090 [Ignavibacteria bacterium RBG_13_36_8]|nr:MAG: hypothetical protein A2V66_07090 [Ignavibacteria bacterium RBG_13_36_8]